MSSITPEDEPIEPKTPCNKKYQLSSLFYWTIKLFLSLTGLPAKNCSAVQNLGLAPVVKGSLRISFPEQRFFPLKIVADGAQASSAGSLNSGPLTSKTNGYWVVLVVFSFVVVAGKSSMKN